MKKQHWLAIGTAAMIALATIQVAGANPQGKGGMMGPGSGRMGQQTMSEEEFKARQAFMAETTGLRKQIATRSAELDAIMAQANPDEKRVAALTGELFDLRDQLRQKAVAAGLPGDGMQNCCRTGKGQGMMGGPGMMMGGPGMQNGPVPQDK